LKRGRGDGIGSPKTAEIKKEKKKKGLGGKDNSLALREWKVHIFFSRKEKRSKGASRGGGKFILTGTGRMGQPPA